MMTKLLLWDLDGTLSNDSHRRAFYEAKEWDKYFSYAAMIVDPTYTQAVALYNVMLEKGWKMGYLTARLERNRPATVDWLIANKFDSPQDVILRPESDAALRPAQFKTAVVAEILASGKYTEVVLVDNDPYVIESISVQLGERHAFLADWDQSIDTGSLTVITPEQL